MAKTEKIKIGVVGVDSGTLMICDPCYLDSNWQTKNDTNEADFGHEIYKHKSTGKLWQFTYDGVPAKPEINKFPGTYGDIILEYGKSPNDMIKSGEFEKTKIDPREHIPDDEFSYRAICKKLMGNLSGQFNFEMGHPGIAVGFNPGFGDGVYDVYAEIGDYGSWGKRVKRITIEFIDDNSETEEGD
jgi:hypothetical protein